MSPFVSRTLVVLAGGLLAGFIAFVLFGPDESDETSTMAVVPTSISVTTTATSSTTTTTLSTTTIPMTTTSTIPPKETLVIQGTGDVNLDPNYISAFAANGYDYAWVALGGLFSEDDLTVINLECAASDIGTAEDKAFVFRCPTESLTSLAPAGVEVANLANNHGGDYGKEALLDGKVQLTAVGVAPVGVGANTTEAGEAAYFDVKGWRVAVVGMGGVKPHNGWFATEDNPGMLNGDDIPTMVEAVERAASQADIVVVTIHWGVELDLTPRSSDIAIADALIEAGADVIFGHHPHRLQPYEVRENAAVFWSLGNFVWPTLSTLGRTTGVARAVVHPDGTIEACLVPAFIENPGQPVLTGEPECEPER